MTIPTIPLVPGDDRTLQITLTDSAGDALDLTGYTVSVAKIAWSGGSIDPLTVGLASAASGIVTITLTDTQSASIPMGRVSALTLQLASAADDKTTYYYAYVNGVPIVSDTTLSSTAIVGIQGQAGSTFRAFPGAPDDGVGNNGDIGIRADTGQIYSKVSGAWVLLDDQPLADSITAAASSASSAFGSASAADASATAASGSASAASASASAASASASSASGSASAAASSASAASSSETAAAASETAAASSATDAQTAQGLAEDARNAAQTAQTAAATSASLVDLGALDDAVTATAADVVSTNTARDKAEQWAEEVEDTEVETGQYSALHHSAKATAQRVLAETAKTATETARDVAVAALGVSGNYSDTTLAAAITTAEAALSIGDTYAATGDDVQHVAIYKIETGPVSTELWRFFKSSVLYDFSYSNPGGTGDRTSTITVTASSGLLAVATPASNFVDGATGANTTDSAAFQVVSASGQTIEFNFGVAAQKVIEEFTWKQTNTSTHGSWKWQAFSLAVNDWVDITSAFTLGGATTQVVSVIEYVPARKFRLLGISGTTSSSPYIQEIEFKIAAGPSDGRVPVATGGTRKQVLRKASATDFDIEWGDEAGDNFSGLPTSVNSLWTFEEGAGSTVLDKLGSSDLTLLATGTPEYNWTGRGLKMKAGVAQAPSTIEARGAFVVYRTKRNETSGFIVSGGPSGSGAGILEDQLATSFTHHIAGGFGVHAPERRASNGTLPIEYNRGGWVLAFVDWGSLVTDEIGFGGRHSTTTSRCADIEIAACGTFDAALSDDERSKIYQVMRRALVRRGVYLHVEDCPERWDCVILHGESNAIGDELLTNFSAADQALRFSDVHILGAYSTASANNMAVAKILELGLNANAQTPTKAGPEIGIAKRWRTNFKSRRRPLVILKPALGSTLRVAVGTGSGVDSNSWHPGSATANSLFQNILLRNFYDLEQSLRNRGIGINLAGMGQSIGLNDAVSTANTTDAATYQGYIQAFADAFEEHTGADLYGVLIRTHNSDASSDATALGHIRTAEAAFVTANSTKWSLVDADAFPKQAGDAAHFDFDGTIDVGEAIYDGLVSRFG